MEFEVDLAGFNIHANFGKRGFYIYLLKATTRGDGRSLIYAEYESGLGWIFNILFTKIDLRDYSE